MFRPDRGLGLFSMLLGVATSIAALFQPPATPHSPRRKTLLRIAAGAIAIISIVAGLFFASVTFAEVEPWARWVTACLTFGLFGFPASLVAIVGGAIVAKGGGSQSAAQSLCTVLLAITYFAQWLLLAAGLLRQSMF